MAFTKTLGKQSHEVRNNFSTLSGSLFFWPLLLFVREQNEDISCNPAWFFLLEITQITENKQSV